MARVWVTLYRHAMYFCASSVRDSETLSRSNVITCLFGMNEQLKTFGANLSKHMNARQISSAVLAEKADVSVKTINNVVQGRHATQIDKLAKLAEALDVQFWTMWIPDLAVDPKNDRMLQGLMETSAHLSSDALVRIVRMAELELNSERSSVRPRKLGSSPKNHHGKENHDA